jgi:hypothetical protein
MIWESFEDTKRAIKRGKSKKDRQYNHQKGQTVFDDTVVLCESLFVPFDDIVVLCESLFVPFDDTVVLCESLVVPFDHPN